MMQTAHPLCRGAVSMLCTPSLRSFSSATIPPALSSIGKSGRLTNALNINKSSPLSSIKRFNATLGSPPAPTLDFDPHAVTAMDKQTPPEPGADFNVVIVGAGNINVLTKVPGITHCEHNHYSSAATSSEKPFPRNSRLEHKLGPRLKVVALIDPSAARADAALTIKRNSFVLSAYKDTIVYPNFDDYVKNRDPSKTPHAIWVGSPPAFRGREEAGRDLENALIKAFPQTAIFIEKPVSTGPVEEAFSIAEKLKKSGNIVSVGYMLRYLKVVQKMKRILEENDLKVMATNARYIMAYEHTAKLDWWDKSQTCGPIVEQATHFCDLSRYFGGEVDLDSVMAHSLEHFEPAGHLRKMPVPEEKIPEDQRIPRITCATWKYESGAVGSLTHAVALHGFNYSTELDVYADGYSLRLVDPYNAPVLFFRRPGDDHEEVVRYQNDDPFFSEVSNLIDNIEKGPGSAPILSSYEDAVKTYALTWKIRDKSEESVREKAKRMKARGA